MKKHEAYGLLAAALLLLAGGAGLLSISVSEAQLSEEEAFNLFQKLGCTACHVGNQPLAPALSWELILERLKEVPTKYGGDLDAFAQDTPYYGGRTFSSWQELIEQMARNVGRSPDDPEIQQIFEFFAAYAGVTPPAEQPPQETPPEETPEETPEAPEEAEEARGIPFGLALVITIAIVAVIVAVIYMVTRR